MKRRTIAFLLFLLPLCLDASKASDYLKRFEAYSAWNQTLPEGDDAAFLSFIKEKTPLAKKLREQWLYKLAKQKNWAEYKKYYQVSGDLNLQCLDLIADYHLGDAKKAFEGAKPLWLNPISQPPVCNQLFQLMLTDPSFDEALITERIKRSLEKRNIALARFLLKQYKNPRLKDDQILQRISQNPRQIKQIPPSDLAGDFYLYGLKRLVSLDMNLAIDLANSYQAKDYLSTPQKQAFIAHVALYKAMRNEADHKLWFQKVKPEYYNDLLIDWEIRAALKEHRWADAEKLIHQSKDKESANWQYWLARSKEALGQKEEAKAIFTKLAGERSFYGFLSSLRLNQPFSFKETQPEVDLNRLKPYQTVLDEAKSYFRSKQLIEASRLLNDFMSELPPEDKTTLIYWLETHLDWTAKALYLSNEKTMLDQLSLRFPLVNKDYIAKHSKHYAISMALIYAIIRQESEFRELVESQAGARGLMQLMPETASMVAHLEKIDYKHKDQLYTSEKNIHLGVAYLKFLAKRFDNHFLLMTTAYNAGPRQVNYWLSNHPPKEIDIWIETLPWHETRNYIKNVIAFYAVYQHRLKQKPDLDSFLKPFF